MINFLCHLIRFNAAVNILSISNIFCGVIGVLLFINMRSVNNLEFKNLEDAEKRAKTEKERLTKSQSTVEIDIEREKNIILDLWSSAFLWMGRFSMGSNLYLQRLVSKIWNRTTHI